MKIWRSKPVKVAFFIFLCGTPLSYAVVIRIISEFDFGLYTYLRGPSPAVPDWRPEREFWLVFLGSLLIAFVLAVLGGWICYRTKEG